MPIYDFLDKATDTVETKMMSIASMEKYLLDNPTKELYHSTNSAPQLIDPVRLGVRRVPDGFKEVLAKIKERAPMSNLDA